MFFHVYFIDLFEKVKHAVNSYKLAADVMSIDFTAIAISQLHSVVGLFHDIAVQYKICVT